MYRGDTFRQTVVRIGQVRSIIPDGVNIVALTATATTSLRDAVIKTIGMHKPQIVAMDPNKYNIMYCVGTFETPEKTFRPVIERLVKERSSLPCMLIYTRTLDTCAEIFLYFRNCLREQITEPLDAPDLPRFRLVEMYTSVVDQSQKEIILEKFTSESQLRIVVATVAFGMGVGCHNVQQIIHIE